jgi:hypothetical protein
VALRLRQFSEARTHLAATRSSLTAAPDGVASVELALASAYLESHAAREQVPALLEEAEHQLATSTIDLADRACFEARLVDQRAFIDNQKHTREGHERALARYRTLPSVDVHPFASYRREAGLAYCQHALGDVQTSLRHAQAAVRHAGDGGFVRLRVMGLLLEARILGDEGKATLERAHAIALRLADEELLARVGRMLRP